MFSDVYGLGLGLRDHFGDEAFINGLGLGFEGLWF